MALSNQLREELMDLVTKHKVVLFMKGNRRAPQCGFSASVVKILDGVLDDYATLDVLARPEVREGIKELSDWPTVPQLYIGGEFVGGADIVTEMAKSGELHGLLGVSPDATPQAAPKDDRASPVVSKGKVVKVSLSAAAVAAVTAAKADDDGPCLRLDVGPTYEHALFFDDKKADDIEVPGPGVTIILDPPSASRADGICVDYLKEDGREGFKIDNPNKDRPVAQEDPLPVPPRPKNPPALTVTDAAFAQFQSALADEEGESCLRVGARRMGATKVDYELGIITASERTDDDFALEVRGLSFVVDPYSARNLDGATIDFVDTGGGASGFKFTSPVKGWDDPRAGQLQELLDREINPSIAAHGGVVELLDLVGNAAYVVMGGGCQGCGMAAVTLQQGIQQRVSDVMPGLRLVDTTDHASGRNPFYQASK
jgi:Grx4 family monothiol glutaredoxin